MLSVFSPKIEQAIELAAQWHDLTYRKSRWREPSFDVPPQEVLRVPVMAHVTAVALLIQRAGWSDDAVAAAFLHDCVEDVNRYGMVLRPERLVELMGPQIAGLVFEVTEEKYDEMGKKRTWRERKQGYLDGLTAASMEAIAISVADKLHNIWTINEAIARGIDPFITSEHWRGLNAGPEDQHWFYSSVLEVSERYEDERLVPMRRKLALEIERFVDFTGVSG